MILVNMKIFIGILRYFIICIILCTLIFFFFFSKEAFSCYLSGYIVPTL